MLTETQRSSFIHSLTSISESAQRISGTVYQNDAIAKIDIGKFVRLIEDLETQIKGTGDPRSEEFLEVTVKELQKCRDIHARYPRMASGGGKPLAEEIFSTVMSLAAALKYYLSLNVEEKPAPQERKSNDNLARPIIKSAASVSSLISQNNAPRRTSQLTYDIMGFAKGCTNAIMMLKNPNVDRKEVVGAVSAILTSVKDLIQEESFGPMVGKESIAKFISHVKLLKEIQGEDITGHPIVQDLLDSLQPMAASVKRAAFDLQQRKSSSGNNKVDNASRQSLASLAENQPIGYKHNIFGGSSNSDDITEGETLVAPEPTLPRPRAQDLSASELDRQKSGVLTSASDLSINESGPSARVKISTVEIFSVEENMATRAFEVFLDLAGTVVFSGKPYKKQIRVDEQSVFAFWAVIDKEVPNYFTKMSLSHVRGITNQKMKNNVATSEFSVFFQALCASEQVLQLSSVQDFFNELIRIQHLISPIVESMPRQLGSPLKEESGALSGSKNEVRRQLATSLERPTTPDRKQSNTSDRLLSKGSFRDGWKSLSFESLNPESSKNAARNSRGSNSSLERQKDKEKSKSIKLFNRSSDIEKKKGHGDPVRKAHVPTSPAKSNSMSRQQFQEFAIRALKEGFVKIDEDQLVLRNPDGTDKALVRCVNGKPRLVAVESEYLLEKVLKDFYTDNDLFSCFILTFRSYFKPHELLIKLIEIYRKMALDAGTPTEAGQMQIAYFLNKWIETSWEDFDRDERLLAGLDKFVTIILGSKKVALMGDQIKNSMIKQKAQLQVEKDLRNNQTKKWFVTNIGNADFLSMDPAEIALNLTRIDFEMFCKIRSSAYVEYLWEKGPTTANVLDAWVDRFNLVSFWIGTEICTTPLLKSRIQVVENMIRIGKHLKDLNNYNGLMALISGLNSSAVRRLQKTWAGISSKQMSALHDLEKTMNPQMNYQNYREIENRSRENVSFVPFLGLYLKDLTFANDGNPKTLASGLLNFDKNWSISDIIKKIDAFHEPAYEFEHDERAYDYCKKLVALPEKRLYNYSLLCEPRAAKSDSVNSTQTEGSAMRLIEKWTSTK